MAAVRDSACMLHAHSQQVATVSAPMVIRVLALIESAVAAEKVRVRTGRGIHGVMLGALIQLHAIACAVVPPGPPGGRRMGGVQGHPDSFRHDNLHRGVCR